MKGVIIFVTGMILYFLLTFITVHNKKENVGVIVVLNMCLGWLLMALFIIFGIFFRFGTMESSSSSNSYVPAQEEIGLKSILNYLNDIEEIKWVEFDENNVYIGFNPKPVNYDSIVKAAALEGNRAIGVRVWGIPAAQYDSNWRPGTGKYYSFVTARYNKIEE